jgi:hypothetical protein
MKLIVLNNNNNNRQQYHPQRQLGDQVRSIL